MYRTRPLNPACGSASVSFWQRPNVENRHSETDRFAQRSGGIGKPLARGSLGSTYGFVSIGGLSVPEGKANPQQASLGGRTIVRVGGGTLGSHREGACIDASRIGVVRYLSKREIPYRINPALVYCANTPFNTPIHESHLDGSLRIELNQEAGTAFGSVITVRLVLRERVRGDMMGEPFFNKLV